MALKVDFLTKEIFIKIITKGLGVFRTLYLLFFFSVSTALDNFYFAKSIVGVVILINILFEITYSHQLNQFKDNLTFIKKFNIVLNKLSFVLSFILVTISLIFSKDSEITTHILVLSLWGILNINSNYFLLLFRYKESNSKVLLYYLLIAIFDILLLISILTFLKSEDSFLSISLSLLISEFLVFILLFSRFYVSIYRNGNDNLVILDLEKETLYKVFLILVVISLIDISDKFFLSFLGEGQITYYTYGLYAPLMIRQSLDIRSNFFVQINKAKSLEHIKVIFYKTLKKLAPFFFLGIIILLVAIELLEDIIKNNFHIENINVFKNIIYMGILITPLYMIWDLFYRFYYKENKINRLVKIVVVGFFVNIVLNFSLGFSLSWGIYGILVSTLTVFLFYNLLSFRYFFIKSK
tara:strand:+ start:4307 stop:5536 length:1230 start_codon:yes stop_codon:yes gene_type:complete